VEALRSGDFQQGKYALQDEGGFCCLGVACELAMRHGAKVEKVWSPEEKLFRFSGQASVMPEVVVEWLGVNSADPDIAKRDWSGDVTKMASFFNDTGSTFEQIADMIETHFNLKGDVE
jgi:hypothetical protein